MKTVAQMTLREKIGQLVFVGFPGPYFDDHLKWLISEYKLGNIVLFARNVANIESLHNLNQNIYHMIMNETGVLPLIAIDQEGGMVMRITEEGTFWPGNMTLSASSNPQNAYLLGKMMGEELRALGINMNLAPSLDVNNNPLNPVIGVRSYGDDPQVVSDFGIQAILGMQEAGIIATAKHFPGHGDTSSDSHYRLPIIPHDKDRLNAIELKPFKEAINNNVKAIMSAHVFFTAYEKDQLPATLSKQVMTNLLRQELKFDGLIVSDCMEMKAIDEVYTASKGALLGLLAGLDMVMVSQTFAKQKLALELIEQAVLEGTFPESLLDEKVTRVLKAKETLLPVMDQYFFKPSFMEKYPIINHALHKKFASNIVDLSLTHVKGATYAPHPSTLVIAVEPFAQTIVEDVLSKRSIIDALKRSQLPYPGIKIKINPDDEQIDEVLKQAASFQQVVVFTYNAWANSKQATLVTKLSYLVPALFVVSTRNPYDILALPTVKNYDCLYEYTPNAVNSAIRFLGGTLMATGKLPVSLKKPIKVGASVYVGLEQSLEANLAYLETLKGLGIELLFISAHMPEMRSDFQTELGELVKKGEALGLKIILDVSKPMMAHFQIPNIYSLRLDYGFSLEEIYELSLQYPFFLELNASTVSEKQLRTLAVMGLDMRRIRVSHNFYPKPYTGLTQEQVLAKNTMFKQYGLTVMVYIPSKNEQRGPIYEGLPTIEDHRYLPLEAMLSEMRHLEVDEVVFGDSFASREELMIAKQFDYDLITIPLSLTIEISEEERKQLQLIHRQRADSNVFGVRSSTRLKQGTITPHNSIDRKRFDVTIDNQAFLRYQGEVTIVKKDMPADIRVNVVGRALISEYLLENLKPGQRFKFIIKE
ncbi:MAG: MupG family TIM beta-alpha barrel fold protein [Bacilli bacterium]